MKTLSFLAAAGFVVLGLAPNSRADTWDKQTYLTFSGPVGVPGATLPKGTYTFSLVDSESQRNIVQVTNKRGDKVYATIITIPDYRAKPTSNTVVSFKESCPGVPEEIKAWFYPGDTYGYRFVYSKTEAAKIAKACGVHVPEVDDKVAAAMKKEKVAKKGAASSAAVTAAKQAPVKEETPEGTEADYDATSEQAADANDTSGHMADTAPKQ